MHFKLIIAFVDSAKTDKILSAAREHGATGSAGQFLFIPVAREFLVAYGWQMALVIMAIGCLSMILFAPAFKKQEESSTKIEDEPKQNLREALSEALYSLT